MANNRLTIDSLAQIEKVAEEFLRKNSGVTVFALFGEMGSGKTTFIKALCKVLGVEEEVTSPTFTLINQYSGRDKIVVCHSDLYRLERYSELIEIGLEEYLYNSHICFIEWPQLALELLPQGSVKATIEIAEDLSRIISWELL
ncbi:MAG: tRNA (adenosine(37)-N6)-threonylcarbamoyltransferase complex ATPase subunit type 1 TsaE [Bacteroidales bacterium]